MLKMLLHVKKAMLAVGTKLQFSNAWSFQINYKKVFELCLVS